MPIQSTQHYVLPDKAVIVGRLSVLHNLKALQEGLHAYSRVQKVVKEIPAWQELLWSAELL